ncbi:unnamed protein product [Victoria cruziana]
MTSVAKVRLVYCPKCQHLLPEVAHFPVYQCGNCKTILQAKHAKSNLEAEHKKPDLSSSCNGAASSKGDLNPVDAPDSKHSNHEVRPEEVYQKRPESPSSSSLKSYHKPQKFKETVSQNNTLHYPLADGCDDTVSSNGPKEYKKEDHCNFNNAVADAAASDTQIDCRKKEAAEITEKCPMYSGCSSSSPSIDSDNFIPEQRLRLSRRTLFKQQEEEGTDGLTEPIEKHSKSSSPATRAMEAPSCSSGFMSKEKTASSSPVSKGSGGPSKTGMHVHRTQIKGHEELYPLTLIQENFEDRHYQTEFRRNMDSRFLSQEPSCFLGPCTTDEVPYNCVETMRSNLDYTHNDHFTFDRIEYLEHERFELLRKVDELRECISRSHLATGRPNGRVPTTGLRFYETDSTDLTWNALGKQSSSTPFFHQNEAKMQDLHHYHKNLILEEDCLEAYRQSPGSHHQPKGMLEARRYPQNPILGHPRICECAFCFSATNAMETGRQTVRTQCVDNSSICMFDPCAHCLEYYERPSQLTSCICSNQGLCRACTEPFCYHVNSPTHALRQTPLNVSVASSFQDSNKKMPMVPEHDMLLKESCHQDDGIVMTMKTTACRPIFGGAPFITCCRCSKLLKLPDLLHSNKRANKVKCGNCFLVLSFAGSNERRITHVRKDGRFPSAEVDEKGENASSELSTCDRREATGEFAYSRPANGDGYQSGPVSFSEEYGASIPGSHFSSDIEPNSLPIPFPALPNHAPEKKGAFANSPEWIRKGMKQASKELMSKRNHCRYTNESNSISEGIEESFRAAAGAPLHAHFGYLSARDLLKRNPSGRKESEIGIAYSPVLGTNRLDKDLSVQEMNFEPSSCLPEKVDREKKFSKDSMIPGFIKKRIRDLSLGSDSMKSKVFVNGRPIPDRSVKKAEERAGPIQPGHYWYDSEAGFWGVMGQPCLGIIPPHIEEFNYPVPRNCTGGKTGIIVNGRELHQKDLDMLARKGLPTVANKEYIINVDGQVIDKSSGERLDLVALAPTVVKAGRGFGMRVSNSIK